MRIHLGGIKFKPIHNDPRGKCQVEMYLKAQLGGIIPTWIQTQALGWTAGGQNEYRKLIAGYLEKNPKSLSMNTPFVEQQRHLY